MKIFISKSMPLLTIYLLVFISLWGCDSSADKQKNNSKSELKQKKIKATASKTTNIVQKSSGLSQIKTKNLNIQSVKQKVGSFEDRLTFLKKTEDGRMPDEDEIIKFLESVNDFDWLLKKVRDLIYDFNKRVIARGLKMITKIAVFISGSGTNLQSIIDKTETGYIPGETKVL